MKKQTFDRILFADVVFLTAIGIVMVYAASAYSAMVRFHDPFYFLKKEFLFFLIGLGAMVVMANVNYIYLRWMVYPLLLLCLFMMVLVLIPGFGVEVGGARRWLRVGSFTFQPSEFTKVVLIIYMAHSLMKKEDKVKDFVYGFVPYMVILGIFFILLMLQPDMGTAVCISAGIVLMLFMAGTRLRYLVGLLAASLPLMYFLIMSEGYRKERFLAFCDPWKVASGSGFQIFHSFLAIGSGGLRGLGLGEGRQQFLFLPEPHTDFILAVIGEQFGFIGAVIVLAAFALFFYRGMMISLESVDPFGRYLALGLTGMISLQALINCAVVVGLLPTKGLPLPMISYGGSSLVMTLVGAGILLNISKWTRAT
jgi:cell division protein FtsW